MYGVIDFSLIDTMPGGFGPFAPPAGWQGDYLQYLRARFDGDIGARQQIAVVGRIIVRKLEGAPTEFIVEQAQALAIAGHHPIGAHVRPLGELELAERRARRGSRVNSRTPTPPASAASAPSPDSAATPS